METVCLLSKLYEAKHHVNVKLDMDEMDLTAAESKATYEEIKKDVAEHNDGMKVSNLYIAQVKRKCGIIERENNNKSKSEKGGQPECPKEKEIAIEEALKYFQMIPRESEAKLAYRIEKIQLMLLSLRTLGIKSDVRRLFVHDNRMFAERAFYCIQKNFSQI